MESCAHCEDSLLFLVVPLSVQALISSCNSLHQGAEFGTGGSHEDVSGIMKEAGGVLSKTPPGAELTFILVISASQALPGLGKGPV